MTDWNAINRTIDEQMDASLRLLARLVAVPSVAAQGGAMREGAELVASFLRERGFETEIMPSDGFPVVVGERKGRRDRTLLLYNHYDVQPAEPFDLWESPPFEAAVRDGKMYGRGVSDDKGHIACRLAAIDALLAVQGELPSHVKFIIEGEEEIGSVHLPKFIERNRAKLAGDACLWEFGDVEFDGVPVQHAGMRGICYVELRVRSASRDSHSGLSGSIFPNAAWRLVWALSTLKDRQEKILIPGFYDKVRAPTGRDLELLDRLPEVADEYRTRYGLKGFVKGLTNGVELRREAVFVPTCTICGLTSGYQGAGSKTVLPAEASAKVDFRLVPDQDPEEVVRQLRRHLDQQGFQDVEITLLGGEPPGRTDPDDPFLQMVVETARPVYGMPMRLNPIIGGSGPNHAFLHFLKVPVATAGVGYPDTRAHAPNENVDLELFRKGVQHTARILVGFAELGT
jgi:acetylornithine deacetylase/succinyl-diaminopimelate desuccinylase-like protein